MATTKNSNRRKFLQNSIKVGASLSLLSSTHLLTAQSPFHKVEKKAPKSLKILLLGGTSFLGPHQIAYALERGHEISTFTRGKTKPKIYAELFDKVESLVGDRENNLEALKGRKWDVVIDNSGRRVKWTEDTAELLKDNADLYMYTSSLSVFYPFTGTDFSENRKVLLEVPEDILTDENRRTYEYGLMKANSEEAAKRIFGKERACVIRPTFIVGSGDPTDRFNHWAARLPLGGEVLIPGKLQDKVQYIDVRDLAAWMIRLAEDKTAGTFNASGPGFAQTMPAFVYGAHASFNIPATFTQVDDYDFLQEQGVYAITPWIIPVGDFEGMGVCENKKAIEHGLTFRSLSDTMQMTIEWWNSDAVSEERRQRVVSGANSMIAREASILKAWKERS